MRICILSDEEIADFNPASFMEGFDWEMVTMTDPVMDVLRALDARKEFDLYLNLCEGYEKDPDSDWEYEGIDVIKALEALNLPFTGADSKFFDPTREEMQAAADANGLGFAKGYQVKTVEEAERLVKNLRYPIMVKHPKSYGSTGMFRESRVDAPEQLRAQVERVCAEFGAARMEEFIVGTEYNVLVVDNPDDFDKPIAYPPAELIFPPGEEFWHTDVKWDFSVPFDYKEVTEPTLVGRLQDLALRMYKAMDGVSCGRCDIRMNADGELFILEINPNPAIMLQPKEFGPADYMILYDPGGYRTFFDRLFRVALIRHQRSASLKTY
jgi:D-alanine-D-alanine ligase-like ATP-grasp enzyme